MIIRDVKPETLIQYPVDYHLSLRHIQLSKQRFLVIENLMLKLVKLKKEYSTVTEIAPISEIVKFEIIRRASKSSTYIVLAILSKIATTSLAVYPSS